MNKVDLLDTEERRELRMRHPEAVQASAVTGEGLDELRSRIAASITQSLTEVELLVPFDAGERLSELHEIAGDLEREDRQDGVLVSARLPAVAAARFSDLATGRSNGGWRVRAARP